MKHSYATLMAFVARADTLEKIKIAKSVLRREQKLEPWELDELYEELQNRKRIIEREGA